MGLFMRLPYSEDDKTATGLALSCENIKVSSKESHRASTWQLSIAKCAVARGKITDKTVQHLLYGYIFI